VCQIYNVYSLGLAVLSVVFLQWLLLHQRHEHTKPAASPDDDIFTDEARPPSPPDIVIPSVTIPRITITNPTPMPADDDDDDDDNKDNNDNNADNDDSDNEDVKPVETETNSSPPADSGADRPISSASNVSDAEPDSRDILPSPMAVTRPRSNSEVSVNVLQLINEQRRFSVSATSAKSATNTGGVTGQLCTQFCTTSSFIVRLVTQSPPGCPVCSTQTTGGRRLTIARDMRHMRDVFNLL